jgi:hypothetical protein
MRQFCAYVGILLIGAALTLGLVAGASAIALGEPPGPCDTVAKNVLIHQVMAADQDDDKQLLHPQQVLSADQVGLVRRIVDERMAEQVTEARKQFDRQNKLGDPDPKVQGVFVTAILGLVLEAVKAGIKMYLIYKFGPYLLGALLALLILNIVITVVTARAAARSAVRKP